MSKPTKDLITADLKKRYEGVSEACVVDVTGLNVQQTQKIRGMLRERSCRMEVVRNSLARRAFADTTLDPIGQALTGPCALVTSSEPITDVARLLVEAAKEFEHFTLKQAMLEGDADLLTVDTVSRMKGRRDLLGDIAGLITAPGLALAGCLRSPGSKIAGCLKALIEKNE